jgi:hypothetical protein
MGKSNMITLLISKEELLGMLEILDILCKKGGQNERAKNIDNRR